MKKYIKIILLTLVFTLLHVTLCFADWVKENGRYRYINGSTGQYVVNNWLQTGNGFYFFDQTGYVVTGWYLINGKYYYFNQDGLMLTGFQTIQNITYYLNPETGDMVTGWIQVYDNGKLTYMYFDQNGAMCKGWKQIGDQTKWYYFNDGKALVDTWAKINDIWYHFNANGSMDTGWILSGGKMYHLNVKDGSLTKGWIQDQYGNEYYLSENDGSLTVNATIMIGGIGYTFDESGKCIAKNQYTGNMMGNTSSFYIDGSGKGVVGAYGVNIGIAPGQSLIEGVSSTSVQQQVSSLTPGSTAGPK